ncbi:MAG: hypothetical protein GX029_07580, partial [Pseudomonadaceae bacterium]|nr:hypothetical protein [Pseudomonadaceae bacterium]
MQASTPQFFDLENQHKNNVELFKKALTTSRFWQLTEKSNAKNLGFYDTETGLINSSLEEFEIFLNQYPFLYLKDQSNKKIATLETASQLLWSNALSDQYYYLSNAKIKIKEFNQSGLKDWKLPFKKQFKSFATSNNNPYRVGEEYKLQSLDKKAIKREVYNIKRGYVENIITTDDLNAKGTTSLWLISEGLYNTNEDSCEVKSNSTGYIFACNEHWKNKHTEGIFSDLAANQWQLISPDGDFLQTDDSFKSDSLEQLQAKFVLKNIVLTSIKDPSKKLDPSEFWIDEQLIDLDYTPCRLPKLDTSQLTDPAKGLWELWGQDTATLQRLGYVPRDPFKDVQRYAIAIDFGTSSTVVAMDTSSGGQELLRIGVRDFYQAIEAKHFENPTVLECLDFSAFKKVWQTQAYRPQLNWDWMR